MIRDLVVDEEAIEEAETETRYYAERAGTLVAYGSRRRSKRSTAGSQMDGL
jgi:hypothetical protein